MRAVQRIAEPAAGVLCMTDSKATCVQALGTSLFSGARLKIESHHLDLVCLKLKSSESIMLGVFNCVLKPELERNFATTLSRK